MLPTVGSTKDLLRFKMFFNTILLNKFLISFSNRDLHFKDVLILNQITKFYLNPLWKSLQEENIITDIRNLFEFDGSDISNYFCIV